MTTEEVVEAISESYNIDEFSLLFTGVTGESLETATSPYKPRPTQIANALSWVKHHMGGDYLPLVEAAANKRPQSQRLRDVVDRMRAERHKRIAATLQDALESTLRKADIEQSLLLEVYGMFAPSGWSYTIRESRTADVRQAVIDNICTLLQALDVRPLLCILHYLAAWHQGTEKSHGIKVWMGDALNAGLYDHQGLSEAQKTVDQTVENRRRARLHLLIELTPPKDKETEFTVRAWRQTILGKRVHPMVPVDGLPVRCAEPELENVVKEIIQRVERLLPPIEKELKEKNPDGPSIEPRMVVELFLPLRLLAEPADQWLLRFAQQPLALSARHWIVVRSWERAYHPAREFDEARWNWRRFWGFRHTNLQGLWADKPLFQQQKYLYFVESKDAWAVALRFVPAQEDWESVVKTGTPVALWDRRDCDARFHAFVDGILKEGLKWLERVSEERRKNGEPHVQRLTLLWDEPDLNRLPPNAIDNIGFQSPGG